jgi:hypothetical protein
MLDIIQMRRGGRKGEDKAGGEEGDRGEDRDEKLLNP